MPLAALSPEVAYGLVAVWLCVLGGVFGSFLNVVVYRLPAGMSLLSPGSHCPACKRPIRWFDNVPVLGWLVLGGRCRDCRAPISPRYPLVEAGCAVMFLAVGLAEHLPKSISTLAAMQDLSEGVALPVTDIARPLESCIFHLLLLCTLLCAALIEYDRRRSPLRLFVPALAVGIVASPFWPWLHPLPAWAGWTGWAAGVRDGMVGLVVGLLLGRLAALADVEEVAGAPQVPSARRTPFEHSGLLFGTACVGLYLGWQAACVVTSITVALHLLLRALRRWVPGTRRIPATAWLFATTLALILCWAQWMAPGSA